MKPKILLFFSLLSVTLCTNAQVNSVNLYQGAALLSSYSSISAANAAIPTTIASPYTIEITASYTGSSETYPIAFTVRTGASSVNTITLRPAAGVAATSITSAVAANPIINLNDADYVIIDGRAGGTGSTPVLTISNTNTASNSTIQFINGATFNKVMYCNVLNATTGSTGRCIYWTTSASNATGNSDNDISFCKFTGGRYMINTNGTAVNPNTRNRLYGCEMINAVFAAIWYQANSGKLTIDSCSIHNTVPISETLYFGILFDSQIDSVIITKNKIYDLGVSGTGTVRAVHFRSSTTGTAKYSLVANNMIAMSSANASSANVGGIEYSYGANGVESHLYFNSIHVQGTQTTGGTSGAVGSAAFITNGSSAATTFDTRNNLFVNSRSGGTAGLQHLAYSNTSTGGTLVSNYNNYFSTSGNLARIGTTVYTTMAAFAAAAAPNEANSFSVNPPFISSTDLHLAASAGTNAQFFGTPITGITSDIDGQTRSTTTPLRGADEIVAVCALTATSTQTNVSCNSGTNGSATVTASGGTGYTYSWSPSGGSAATATGLAAGPYAVTITSGSCSIVQNITITEPAAITSAVNAQTNVSCNAGNNGSATITASGGTPGYTYSWSPSGGSAATATGLAAGTYAVTITDANSCTKVQSVTITQPAAITSAVIAQTNVSCNGGNNGSATVTASGGTPGYTYSWSPSGGSAATATGLAAGTYSVTITDANSCTKVQSVTITQPAPVTMNVVANQTVCNGASAAAATFSSAIAGATYAWTNNNTGIGLAAVGTGNIAAFTAVNTGTAPVTATITVTPSAGGCTGTPVTFTITVNPSPVVTLAAFAPICQNTGNITLTGGLPAGGNYTVDGIPQTVFNPANYTSGIHSILYTFSNASGCTGSATQTITIAPPFTVVLTTVPSQNITPATPVTLAATVSPAQPYIYQWIKNGTDTLAGNNSSQITLQAGMSGSWEVLVTSTATGCKIKSVVSNILPTASSQLFIWPNPNNGEFTLSYYGLLLESRTIALYDSKGAKVYSREFSQNVPYTPVKIKLNVAIGSYYARITDSTGKTIAGGTVVVYR